jgi:RNA polymerase sigma-70 factor (ECF subfamily)
MRTELEHVAWCPMQQVLDAAAGALELASSTFEELHAAFNRDLTRYVARRIRDAELTRDIVQETFLRAYRARRRFDDQRPAWPWLATIARNLIHNARRDEHRRRLHVSAGTDWRGVAASADPRSEIDPEKSFSLAQSRTQIRDALSSLAARQRRVLLLRVVNDLSYHEIAAAEGISSDAVKSLIKRARRAFRESYASIEREAG